MKLKTTLIVFYLFLVTVNKMQAQSLTCLSPTLVFTDPLTAGNPVISSTINCDFPGFIRVSSSPVLNGALTQGNSPCIRVQTSLTNGNSTTNNSMALFQGTANVGSICGSTCALSIPNNSLFSLYWPGLTPSQTHSIALCNSLVAPNMTYSVYSCYSNVLLNTGTWVNSSANSCQTITIPANTAIGSASFVINPAVPPAAIIQDFGAGYITLDPYSMAAGIYTITYNFNSQNGCTTSATRTLQIVNPFVSGSSNFVPPTGLCPYSNCVNLLSTVSGYTSSASFPFFSGTGVASNTFCPASAGPGSFPVTYEVGPTAICGATITNNIVVNNLPVANAGPTKSLTCSNPFTVSLNGSGGGTYNWSGPSVVSGGTSANPVVGAIGNYSVNVTSAAGCTAQAVVGVVQNTTQPTVSANAVSNIITCANPQATVSVASTAGVTYAWSGPGIVGSNTGAAITASLGGTYNVVATNTANGCTTNTLNITATQNTTITNVPSTTGFVGCANSIINLSTTASGPYGYTWLAPVGSTITSGASAQNAVANSVTGGNFTITVNNAINGCSSTSVIALTVNQAPPAANASNVGVVTCTNAAINLNSSSSSVTFTWVPPAGSSITSGGNTNAASGSGGGTYTLLVTSTVNSCTNSAITAVTSQTVKPTPTTVGNPTITCANATVNISSSPASGVTYTWSGGSIVGSANNQAVNVNAAGVYSLSVTSNSNGCVSNAPATVTITSNLITPTLNAASTTATLACGAGSVVTLSVTANPAGTTFTWVSSGGAFASGINSSSVQVTSATVYSVTASHPVTGCISFLTYTISPSSGAPSVSLTLNSATVTCSNPIASTSVSGTGGLTYSWSGPGIVGSTTNAAVSGSLAGTYNYVATNGSGCSSPGSFIISANNGPVNPNASISNTVNCTTTTANIITAATPTTGAFTYSWNTGATTSSLIVNPTSNTNYIVTVTNTANGCVGTQTISAIANTNPPTAVSVSPNTFTLSCATPNTSLTASATGATTYSWIAPSGGSILSGVTSATATISGAGIYSVIATGANGCSANAQTATVVPNSAAPSFTISNASPSITCLSATPSVSVTITSSVAITSYSWGPASGISGAANTNTVMFNTAGTYTGIITASNGCISNAIISVVSATTSPTIVAGTGTAQTLSCTNSVVTIAPTFTPNANLTYLWTGTGIVGSPSNSSVQVNQNGSYSLTVTNTLTGCSTTSISIPVFGSNIPPSLNVTSSSSIGVSCQPNTNTVNLTANAGSAVTYSWSTGATTSVITTGSAGVYSLTVTDIATNCSATNTIAVANNTITPTLTASANGSLPCGGGTVALNAVSSNTNTTYTWLGLGIVSGSNTATSIVNTGGTYTVNVIDNITNCSSTQTLAIVQTTVVAQFTANPISGPAPLTVNFTNQSVGAITYSWSLGNGTSTQQNPSNIYSASGNYTVVLTSINGACTSTAEIIINVLEGLGVIPEVFTPNGDLYNNTFEIKGLDGYPNNSLQVFNRWGNSVYSAKPYKNDWNGAPNVAGKTGSDKLPTGTYYYILELGDDAKTIYKGYVQLQY